MYPHLPIELRTWLFNTKHNNEKMKYQDYDGHQKQQINWGRISDNDNHEMINQLIIIDDKE